MGKFSNQFKLEVVEYYINKNNLLDIQVAI